jgi:WD40 repeat protein
MQGYVGDLSDDRGKKVDASDLDDRTRQQYLAILQFMYDKDLHDAISAFEQETGVCYEEGCLPVSSVLEGSLDMFANYGSSNSACVAVAEDDILQKTELGVCCTGPFEDGAGHELKANITAVAWAASGDDDFIALAASTDRKLSVLSPDGQILTVCTDFSSPLLALDVARTSSSSPDDFIHHFEILATAMGGEAFLLRLSRPGNAETDGSAGWDLKIVQRFKDHAKHVSSCRFAPPVGKYPSAHFLTASRDHNANVYRRVGDACGDFILAGTLRFAGDVTCCCWVGDRTFALAVRENHNLHYWDVDGGADGGPKERLKTNLNATGDSVVSFAVLALDVSPDRDLIAACTDKSRVIILKTFTDKQLRNLYGAFIDEYDVPSVCFSSDRSFVYVTSTIPFKAPSSYDEGDEATAAASAMCGQVLVFEVISGNKVLTLPCHSKPVRCMARHPHAEALVTGSFDKTVRFWR